MNGPPPSPRGNAADAQRELLIRELRALETPELLALCLRGRSDRMRLRMYLGILRGRPGTRAQLASCLVCFDLARQGDDAAQHEFLSLAPTIEELARDGALVAELVSRDAYLDRTWADCQAALDASDQRELSVPLHAEATELVGELTLLSDDDFGDLGLEILDDDSDAARAEQAKQDFARILAIHLGQNTDQGLFGAQGFETTSSRDLDRLQGFLNEAISYSDLVTTARGLASLGHLFLATHLRMKSLFGKRNARRAAALRTGLLRLPGDAAAVEQAATIFELEGGPAMESFEKVVELLIDFLAFCNHGRRDPRAATTVDAYVEAERTPPPVLLTGDSRRRRG